MAQSGESQLTLIGRIEDELALSTVDHHAGDQIAYENEYLCDNETFPEVISVGRMWLVSSLCT